MFFILYLNPKNSIVFQQNIMFENIFFQHISIFFLLPQAIPYANFFKKIPPAFQENQRVTTNVISLSPTALS